MSRSSFQRLALVTLVVLLATVASNRLGAYASSGHPDALLAPMHPIVTVHTQEVREVCRIRMETRHRADVHREMAQVQRELAREQQRRAEDARLLARDLQRELRAIHVVVN